MILPRRGRRLIERFAEPLDDAQSLLFDDPATGLLVADRTYRIVRANPRLIATLERVVDADPLESLFAPCDWPAVQTILTAGLRGDRLTVPVRARLAGRDQLTVAVSAVPLREADGSCSGLLVRLTNIDAEHRLEARLAHGQKLHTVGQLAGGIAHDFNNLLTAIIGAADSILARAAADPESVDDLHQVRLAAERGAALVRQLLAFGGRQPLQPRVIAINAAIRELAGLLQRLLGAKVRLVLDLELPGRLLRIDPTQLDQVLVNLAVNAGAAMPDGGTLTLRSYHRTLYRPETQGPETIPPGRYVLIEIEDTGVGIPVEFMSRIFEPFFTTKRASGGSGLGLPIVLGITRQSEGFLAVDSVVGRGTTVRLYLPRYEGDPPTEAATTPADLSGRPPLAGYPSPGPLSPGHSPPEHLPPGHLLLVEDDDAVRRFAERGLRRAGWVVTAADCAEAALGSLSHLEPAQLDLLVSDVVMPGMEGPALVDEIRKIWPALPAILVSGYAESALKGDLPTERVVFLPKPFGLTDLLAAVTAVRK